MLTGVARSTGHRLASGRRLPRRAIRLPRIYFIILGLEFQFHVLVVGVGWVSMEVVMSVSVRQVFYFKQEGVVDVFLRQIRLSVSGVCAASVAYGRSRGTR